MEHVGPAPPLLLGTFLSCPLVIREREKGISVDIIKPASGVVLVVFRGIQPRNVSHTSSQQADTSQGKSWASCTLLALRTKPSPPILLESPTWELVGFHDMSKCPPECTSQSIHRTHTSDSLQVVMVQPTHNFQ